MITGTKMEAGDTENVDKVILSRISLRDISVITDEDEDKDVLKKSPLTYDERKWRLSYLRNQFESFELHNLFTEYNKKVNYGYFSIFLILQGLLGFIQFLLVLTSNLDSLDIVSPDLILYNVITLLSCVDLYLIDKVGKDHKKLRMISIVAFGVIHFVNSFIPIYHKVRYGEVHRPAYSFHLVIACYLFLGIQRVTVAVFSGVVVSLVHISTLYFINYSNDNMKYGKMLSDGIFAAFVNALGIYYRYMNEIVIRRSFLDRRDCIMSTFQLRHEKNQVDQLMQSIIPKYLVTKVKQRYINTTKAFLTHGKVLRENPFDNSLLEEHENVSILFADIVNYTEMTSKLDITELLDTLNDLFGLFDDASDKLKVSRIKFLGDCYYCVAGLPPEAAPNHAEACVDLGLAMISIIADVRSKRFLNVNMRIGVHSGRIISGIIGSVKYQFDIWSKDVDIANKMESEGQAGMVHITNTTKALLKKPYIFEPTDKGETVAQFKNHGLQTFLVKPEDKFPTHSESAPTTPRPSMFKKQRSFPNGTLLAQLQRAPSVIEENNEKKSLTFIEDANRLRASEDRLYRKRTSSNNNNYRNGDYRRSTGGLNRRTAFMNNNIKRYSERANLVNREMKKTIDQISFSKYQQYVKQKDINVLILFNNWKTELKYLKIPDALFKYYLIAAISLIFSVYLLQNLTLKRWDLTTWPILLTTVPLLFVFIPVSWAEFIYSKYLATYAEEVPKNFFLRILCQGSAIITNCFPARIMIFLVIYLSFSMSVLNEMIDCRSNFEEEMRNTNKSMRTHSLLVFSLDTISDNGMLHCVLPWHMTQTCAMAVIMSFLFLRIFIWIKLLLGAATIAIYAFCVFSFSEGYYKESESFNHGLRPQIAHIIATVFLTIALHFVDRQTDFMNRLNYLMNEELRAEQEEANLLQKVNENLLINILPKHVADVYLDITREQKELYFEEHNDVAVMFASIITDADLQDLLDERVFLRLMNTYITEFDILTNRKEFQSIEKIKIAKWTYMVACGLFPGGKSNEIERHQTSASLEILLNFASEMFKKLEYVNKTHFQSSKLRIGISHGPIAAGVVGSKKPLYDIWGDPVNMASRMDSTGLPNHIQILENTAEIVQHLGYSCKERGNIRVKGKGFRVTYFVEIDEKFNLIKKTSQEDTGSLYR